MKTGEVVSKQKLTRFYWPKVYYDLEDLGYVRSVGQKRKGCPSSYVVLKTLPTPARLRKELKAVKA